METSEDLRDSSFIVGRRTSRLDSSCLADDLKIEVGPRMRKGDDGSGRKERTDSYVHPYQSSTCPQLYKPVQKNLSPGSDLWVDGLLCAYEFIPRRKRKLKVGGKFGKKDGGPVKGNFTAEITISDSQYLQAPGSKGTPELLSKQDPVDEETEDAPHMGPEQDQAEDFQRNQWVPIGWARIGELVAFVEANSLLSEQLMDEAGSDEDAQSLSVADQAAPYWQLPAGPIWWCHVHAAHPRILAWLSEAQWLHPAISSALHDESRLISDRMKHLFYEVPVRVAGGLLFELLGQSVGNPHDNEDDVPIVLRSWTSLNFLITVMHVKGDVPNELNVIGISEVQDIVGAGGASSPKTAHEVVALLVDRLSRWDDRLYRKHYFGQADEVELKFVSRRPGEDLAILGIILNQEIRRLSSQIIRVKWALHAREEILYELVSHLRGKNTLDLLNKIASNTRAMLGEQEAVRDRLFTVQDVMQSTVRASLQDKSVRIQHNLAVIGGGGLFLSIIAGVFGINLDGIPGNVNSPHAFGIFMAIFCVLGAVIVGLGILYLGLRKPPSEEQLASRKLELQDLVKHFQNSAESHEKVKDVGQSLNGAKGILLGQRLGSQDYILIA